MKMGVVMACDLCSHVYAQKHRIIPGAWGGTYADMNVAWLCPNHHAAVHLLMKWYHRKLRTADEYERLEEYHADRPLMTFFQKDVLPVVIERLTAEGRWYPYVRTLTTT